MDGESPNQGLQAPNSQSEEDLQLAISLSLSDQEHRKKYEEFQTSPVGDNVTKEDLQDMATCIFCLLRPRSHVFMDCKHLSLCKVCIKNFSLQKTPADDRPETRCPICRCSITQTPLEVYF